MPEHYGAHFFGERVAAVYDDLAADMFDAAVVTPVDVYDVVTQRLTSHHFVISEEKINSYPVEGRYAWPSELDLMARLAGLTLRERWGGWKREPFTSVSRSHVSVYEKS